VGWDAQFSHFADFSAQAALVPTCAGLTITTTTIAASVFSLVAAW
jgi:hypothetical protein